MNRVPFAPEVAAFYRTVDRCMILARRRFHLGYMHGLVWDPAPYRVLPMQHEFRQRTLTPLQSFMGVVN
jgi:hypothetical protein